MKSCYNRRQLNISCASQSTCSGFQIVPNSINRLLEKVKISLLLFSNQSISLAPGEVRHLQDISLKKTEHDPVNWIERGGMAGALQLEQR